MRVYEPVDSKARWQCFLAEASPDGPFRPIVIRGGKLYLAITAVRFVCLDYVRENGLATAEVSAH